MKARTKLSVNLSWEFPEIEYNEENQSRLNAMAEQVMSAIRSVVGVESKADVHWDIQVLHTPHPPEME